MAELQKESPDLWFGARLSDGSVITYGDVPPELASLVPHLDKLSSADIRGHVAPYTLSAVVRKVTGPAGEMKVIAHGRVHEAYDRQRRFIASAAHELRTPIAILRMKIDAANEKSCHQHFCKLALVTSSSRTPLECIEL